AVGKIGSERRDDSLHRESGAAWDEGCLPHALSGGWHRLAKRRIWYEGCVGGKESGELLLVGREPRKGKAASSSGLRSSASQRHRDSRGCLCRPPEEGGADLHTRRRCAFDHDARGNRRLDCAALRRDHFGFQMVKAPEFVTRAVD